MTGGRGRGSWGGIGDCGQARCPSGPDESPRAPRPTDGGGAALRGFGLDQTEPLAKELVEVVLPRFGSTWRAEKERCARILDAYEQVAADYWVSELVGIYRGLLARDAVGARDKLRAALALGARPLYERLVDVGRDAAHWRREARLVLTSRRDGGDNGAGRGVDGERDDGADVGGGDRGPGAG